MKRLRKWLFRLVLGVVLLSALLVIPLRWVDPPTSAFMLRDGLLHQRTIDRRPVPPERISPHLALAVIAAEDQNFPNHWGFDTREIRRALEDYRRGSGLRGASTITQQLAKNLYLWPNQSWERKGLESWFTVWLELFLPKQAPDPAHLPQHRRARRRRLRRRSRRSSLLRHRRRGIDTGPGRPAGRGPAGAQTHESGRPGRFPETAPAVDPQADAQPGTGLGALTPFPTRSGDGSAGTAEVPRGFAQASKPLPRLVLLHSPEPLLKKVVMNSLLSFLRFRCASVVACAAISAMALSGPITAEQPDRDELLRMINETREAARQAANPLEAYRVVASAYERSESDAARNAIGQTYAALLAELGRNRDAAKVFPFGPGDGRGGTHPDCPDRCSWRVEPAAEAIAESAADFRVIMVNEAHHVPRSRWLTYLLLEPLRERGYTHLALEALDAGDTRLAEREFAVTDSGHYVREPVFAELVREALRLGYVLVAYEPDSQDDDGVGRQELQQRRETGQARNLASVFEENSDARLLVHAGYAHIFRNQELFGARPMIDEFERITGLSTLAVDQTNTLAGDDPDKPGKHFDAVLETIDTVDASLLTAPSVLRGTDGSFWSLRPNNFDISILVPRFTVTRSESHWLSLGERRQAHALDGQPCGRSIPCLIEARYAEDPKAAVAADRALLRTSSDEPVLWLKPGCYRIRIFTSPGSKTMNRCVGGD